MPNNQESNNIDRIAEISTNIRKAVLAALPTPPEQFMTLMVPGKVVNFENYRVEKDAIVLPTATELNQAILCDDMPVLSTLQMGPTGRSVARSYAATISKLVPAGTPIGIDDGNSMTEDQRRYKQAMQILSADLPDLPGTSLVELYTQKQSKYTKAVSDKTKAFNDALELANKLHPLRPNLAREAYDKWVGENARTYRNHVQAAYMDWVVTGRKEEVEYWFSVVDQDSALARVEQSKEVMRWAVVQDSDGSCEYQKVKLEPQDWANKCLDKMNSNINQTKTAEWYTWEINRLEKTNAMIDILANNPPQFETDNSAEEGATKAAEALSEAMKKQLTAAHEYRAALNALKAKKADGSSEDQDAKAKVDAALETYKDAQKKYQECQTEHDKANLKKLSYANRTAHNDLLGGLKTSGFAESQLNANRELIEKYNEERKKLLNGPLEEDAPKTKAIDEYAESMCIPKRAPEPVKPVAAGTKPEPDYFTPITVEVTSSSETKRTESSATSFSAGASASWGFWSVSASVSHSEAHSKAMSELSNSSVKISFECMRVDITRPWLRPELFYEHDLVPGPGVSISPGFSRLHEFIEGKATGPNVEEELENYSIFSYYPTAFLVACNVVLEISGSTSSLETYMNSSSTSASASVGYGPFSISGSGSHSKSDAGSTCKTTASGCRIEIKAPQIIGWISQMVPALPRLSKVQTTGFSQGGFKPIGWK